MFSLSFTSISKFSNSVNFPEPFDDIQFSIEDLQCTESIAEALNQETYETESNTNTNVSEASTQPENPHQDLYTLLNLYKKLSTRLARKQREIQNLKQELENLEILVKERENINIPQSIIKHQK